MDTFILPANFSADQGVTPSGDASSPSATGSSQGAFQGVMDECLAKVCGVDMEAAEFASPNDAPAENAQDDAAPAEGVILAGLQAAQAAVQVFVADTESAVSTEASPEVESFGTTAAISPDERNAVDAWAEDEASAVSATNPADGQGADIRMSADARQNATAPKVQSASNAPAFGREVAATILADEQVADVRIPTVAGQDATAEKVQGASDALAPGREVAEKIFADGKAANIRDARQDAALSLRQFQAADKSGEPGFASDADSASSDASDERGAFTGSDAKAVQTPPSPAAPATAGFAVSLAETAQPTHTHTFAAPEILAAPQRSFEVGEHAFVLTRKSDTSVEVILSPPGVGRLEINVALEKGVINANIIAADQAGREAIERSLPNIIQMLANEGIAVGGFNVSLKNGGYGTSETQQAASAPGDDAGFIAAPEAPRIKAKSGLVDIFV